MKTHVRTKLGWSKLVLISAVLAVVAMLSVIGLCFTNANADDTADPANANLNIPVNNLAFNPTGQNMFVGETKWVSSFTNPPEPQVPYTQFSYGITDSSIQWIDEKRDSYIKLSEKDPKRLEVGIAAKNLNGQPVYKIWTFLVKADYSWYLVENGKLINVPSTSYKLNTSSTYSIYFGRPETFGIKSDTPDVTKISGEYNTFYKDPITIKDVILPTLFDLTGQVNEGSAYYIPDETSGYRLVITFIDALNRESTYNIMFKVKTGKYEWVLNGKPVSTDKSKPTKLEVGQYNTNSFTIKKAAEPEPITSFKVNGTIVDVDGNPIPNATVGFYNAEMDVDFDEPMVSALTDESGYFVLEGCNTGTKEPEKGLKITYAAKHYGMDDFPFNYEDIKSGEVTLEPIELEPAIIDLYSDSPQHKSFTITEVCQEKGKEPEIRFSRNLEYYGISDLGSNGIDNPVFNISDNGVLVNVYTDDEETTTTTIAPNGQDGYIFDNYVINDKATYRVGDSVDISQPIKEDKYAKISTNYVADSSKIAKTGDENIYAIVALIAIVATVGAVLVLRRRKQDF